MKTRTKLLWLAAGLSLLALMLNAAFGSERVPKISADADVWISVQDEDILSKLTTEEKALFRDMLATQKKMPTGKEYTDYVVTFTVYNHSKPGLEGSLYRLADGTNEFVIRYTDGGEYLLDTRAVLKLLTSQGFDELFEYIEDAPTMTVSSEMGSVTVHCAQNGWQYKKIDNSLFMDGVIKKDGATSLETSTIDSLGFAFSTPAQSVMVEFVDPATKKVLYLAQPDEVAAFDPPASGSYLVRVTAQWYESNYQRYFGQCVYEVTLHLYKKSEASFSAASLRVGELLTVTVYNPENPQSLQVQTDMGRAGMFAKVADGVWACLVTAERAGEYQVTVTGEDLTQTLTVTAQDVLRQTMDESFPLWWEQWQAKLPREINDEETPTENAPPDEQEESTPGEEPSEEETEPGTEPETEQPPETQDTPGEELTYSSFAEAWQRMRNQYYFTKNWRGRFEMPLVSAPLTHFGQTFVGQPTQMNGAVFWTVEGETHLTAANFGLVVLVDRLDYGGLTVVIDHGLGVKTWYYGLHEADVKVGDAVRTGMQIGSIYPPAGDFCWAGYQLVLGGGPIDPVRARNSTWLE